MLMGASLGHTFPTWRLSVKVGDLVKYNRHGCRHTGIIIGFDRDDDPLVWENDRGVAMANWRSLAEVISESR